MTTKEQPTYLEIRLHLADGAVARFVVEGEEAVGGILEQVQRGKVFSQQSLILADEYEVAVFPGPALTRLDLILDRVPEALRSLDFVGDAAHRREITENEWRERVDALRAVGYNRQEILGREGDPLTAYGRLRMTGGALVYFAFDLTLPNGTEQRRFLHNFFALPGFPFEALGGGVSVLNPAQVIQCAFQPGAEPPATAWNARAFDTL